MHFVCKDNRFFAKGLTPKAMRHRFLITIMSILISFTAYSGPARKDLIYLNQPDGTTFGAYIRGDEFMKITTTEQGHALIQDREGWWCYARYDGNGVKHSTGWHAGTEVPDRISAESRFIPYNTLVSKAGTKRKAAQIEENEPLMARVMKHNAESTKADDAVTKHGLIILAQFRDVKFTYSRADFVSMLTRSGYNHNGATGSAKEYFDAQFNGAVDFRFDVTPIVTLPSEMAFYGENDSDDSDKAPEQMVIEACRLVDNDVDFSQYDDDGDGDVDNVFVFFAGGDEAEGAGSDCIWSHAWYIYSGAGQFLSLDGKRIDRYACTSELSRRYSDGGKYRDVLAGIGSFCHEYFHTFGIPDMYDTDYEGSGGYSASLWAWTSLMDAGNQNNYGNTPPNLNAVERDYLGINRSITIEKDGRYSLEPIHIGGIYYRMETDHKDEYYLIECRSEEGWDRHIGGNGMLVYHIDKSKRGSGHSDSYSTVLTAAQRWSHANEVNCRPDHQCADLVEADSRRDAFSESEKDTYRAGLNNIRGVFFPNGNVTSIKEQGRPGLASWSGEPGKAGITNIKRTDEGISFNVIGFSGTEAPPAVTGIVTEAFTDAAIIRFESDRPFDGEAAVTWGRTGQQTITVYVTPYETGRYSITLEGLEPDNKTYTADIHFEINGMTGEPSSASFMTKKTPAVDWPFIYMNGVVKNTDGSLPAGSKLPLRLYNASDAAEITWELDGREICPEGDGYFTVSRSGVLKAHIIWQDGSEETVMKEIIIRKEDGE